MQDRTQELRTWQNQHTGNTQCSTFIQNVNKHSIEMQTLATSTALLKTPVVTCDLQTPSYACKLLTGVPMP